MNLIENDPANKRMGKSPALTMRTKAAETGLEKEAIKKVLNDWLIADGWNPQVAWGKSHGADIEALKNGKRWLIAVKGPGSRQQMRNNYFASIFGETLQRMTDLDARYSIAFPDMPAARKLRNQLPRLAKQRTAIDLLLVNGAPEITTLQE